MNPKKVSKRHQKNIPDDGLNKKALNFLTSIQEKSNFKARKISPGASLFCLTNDSKLRRLADSIASSPRFDILITATILVSSVTLALENPLNDPEGSL